MGDGSSIMIWALSTNFLVVLGTSLSSRFISFIFLHFSLNKLGKQRRSVYITAASISFIYCLYLISGEYLVEVVRRDKNFVNSRPIDNLINRIRKNRKFVKEQCFDRLYQGADINFVESMLIVSEVEKKSKQYKVIKAISSFKERADKYSSIDDLLIYKVSDCFFIKGEKYYSLANDNLEYAIEEKDLDFAGKRMFSLREQLLDVIGANDLSKFKIILSRHEIHRIPVIGDIISTDRIEFFKALHELKGEEALVEGLSFAKKDSEILDFSKAQPISIENASKALSYRILSGTPEEIKILLSKGATFNYDNGNQLLPVLSVFRNKEHFKNIIELYLAHGGDINAKSRGGITLLLSAKTMDEVEFLLQKGAHLNDTDDEGRNLLLRTAQFNSRNGFPLMRYLVEKGIDKSKRNDRGSTAYDFIVKECKNSRRDECQDIEFLK
jgi:hypothetical protein